MKQLLTPRYPVALILCLVIATAFVLVFSPISSPIINNYYEVDNAVFMSIGKWWTEGSVPCRDYFDHKGPLIYLINAIPWLLCGSPRGLFPLQTVFWGASLYFIFSMLRMEMSGKRAMLLTLLVLLPARAYWQGNSDCIEEWNLPFLAAAMLLMYRYIRRTEEGDFHLPKKYAFVYGIALGASLLLRLTDGLGVFGGVAVIGIFLMYKGMWRNLWTSLLWCVIGFLTICLPFVIYFLAVGGFEAMWYSTFVFNAEYSKTPVETILSYEHIKLVVKDNCFTTLPLMGLSLILMFRAKERLVHFLVLGSAGLLTLWFFEGNGFPHYSICALPLCPLFFIFVRHFLCLIGIKNARVIGLLTCLSAFVLNPWAVNGLKTGVLTAFNLNDMQATRAKAFDGFDKLTREIPQFDIHDAESYNVCWNTEFWLHYNARPRNRFWFLQDFHAKHSESIKPKIREQFQNTDARFIVFCTMWRDVKSGENSLIKDILRQRYKIVGQNKEYIIYELRN